MIDPTAITAAALLATAAQQFAGEAGKRAWSGIGHLVELVRGKLASDPEGRAALATTDATPTDQASVHALAQALNRHVMSDPTFGAALAEAIRAAERDPAIGRFVTQISGNARVGKLVTIDTVHGTVSF
jgi:hypothetical protein